MADRSSSLMFVGSSAGRRLRVALAMASRAGRQTLNLVFRLQTRADLQLIAVRHIAHLRHEFAGPEVLLRVAMAVEAPLHLQAVHLVDAGHLIDAAVARLAADALLHVNAVVEV